MKKGKWYCARIESGLGFGTELLGGVDLQPHQSAQKEHENHGDEGDVVAAGQLYQIPKDDGGQEGAGLRGGVHGAGDGTSVAGGGINAKHEGRWVVKRNPKKTKREEGVRSEIVQ